MTESKPKIVQHRKASFYFKKYLTIFIGALIASVGLEIFLIPNEVIDGGVVGLSIKLRPFPASASASSSSSSTCPSSI